MGYRVTDFHELCAFESITGEAYAIRSISLLDGMKVIHEGGGGRRFSLRKGWRS